MIPYRPAAVNKKRGYPTGVRYRRQSPDSCTGLRGHRL